MKAPNQQSTRFAARECRDRLVAFDLKRTWVRLTHWLAWPMAMLMLVARSTRLAKRIWIAREKLLWLHLGVLGVTALLVASGGAGYAMNEKRSVLLLNSYHYGFPWSDNITNAVVRELDHEAVELIVEYMDTKRFPLKDEYHRVLDNLYSGKYAGQSFDLIITTDDTATSFALDHQDDLFEGAPIVFSGVNDLEIESRIDRSKVTGVLEIAAEKQTLDLIRSLHPDATEVVLIYDKTPTGEYRWEQIESLITKYPELHFQRVSGDETLEELEQYLSQLGQNTVVLMASYYRDSTGRHISLREGVRRISAASARPVYTLHYQVFQNGTMGGLLLGGDAHGEKAAEYAEQILNGTAPESLPIFAETLSQPMFRYGDLTRFGLSKENLPAGAIIVDRPTTGFRIDAKTAIGLSGMFIALFVINGSLFIAIRRKNEHRKELEALNSRIAAIAVTDHLTSVGNRYAFEQHCIDRAEAEEDAFLVLIDIDNMKLFNDSYGHPAGDKILATIAERLQPFGACFRLGGDEFALWLNGDEASVAKRTKEISVSISDPVMLGNDVQAMVSASIGVAAIRDADSRSTDWLVRLADAALMKSKRDGKNRVSTYHQGLHFDLAEISKATEFAQHLVLENGTPVFHFQPIVELSGDGLMGYEMLFRPETKDGLPLAPPLVILAFENIGQVSFFTQKTFEAAADFLTLKPESKVSINLNKSQISYLNGEYLNALIAETNIRPSNVIIEVNESDDIFTDEVQLSLTMLKTIGFTIAIDDFGTGYSALATLEQLPFDIVKLDKAFVSPNRKSDTLLRSVCALCAQLNLPVIAEGIELPEDAMLCKELGIPFGQGYYFGCPAALK